jgi:hypothetical protein
MEPERLHFAVFNFTFHFTLFRGLYGLRTLKAIAIAFITFWSFHSGEDIDGGVLDCDDTRSWRWLPTFQRNIPSVSLQHTRPQSSFLRQINCDIVHSLRYRDRTFCAACRPHFVWYCAQRNASGRRPYGMCPVISQGLVLWRMPTHDWLVWCVSVRRLLLSKRR